MFQRYLQEKTRLIRCLKTFTKTAKNCLEWGFDSSHQLETGILEIYAALPLTPLISTYYSSTRYYARSTNILSMQQTFFSHFNKLCNNYCIQNTLYTRNQCAFKIHCTHYSWKKLTELILRVSSCSLENKLCIHNTAFNVVNVKP